MDDADSQRDERQKHGYTHPSEIDPYDISVQHTPTATRTFVGPTPQKNGQILGLFDLLSPPSAKSTPSKRPKSAKSVRETQNTPSKARLSGNAIGQVTPSKSVTSPLRSVQANILLTPSARRFDTARTPISENARHDETPDFLRRGPRRSIASQAAEVGNGEEQDPSSWSPIAVRMPPRTAGTGLTALVKGLKDMEEDRLDEEMELLRDLEQEERDIAPGSRKPRLQVEDSRIQPPIELPLGADGESESTDDDDIAKEGLDRCGKPLKVWKKRGQKRTTRKVNIKPTSAKWKPEPAWKPHEGSEEENKALESGNEVTQGDHADEDDVTEMKVKAKTSKPSKDQLGKAGRPKKVSPAAHANYRALKIKSKGTKFRGRGKFGRR